MAREVLETAIGLPANACKLLCVLVLLEKQGERATRDRLAELMGARPESVSRIMRDLLRTKAIIRTVASGGYGQGTEYTWKINHNVNAVTIRKDDGGKAKRCKRCRAVNPLGVYCEKCKQVCRKDRAWNDDAVSIAQGMRDEGRVVSVYKVQAELVRRGYDSVPLWDRAQGANDKRAAGLVSVLLAAGLIGDEWRRRQRAAENGESEEW